MADRVEAQDGIEAAVRERQRRATVQADEGRPVAEAARGGPGLGVRDGGGLEIQAGEPTPGVLDQRQRGAAGTAGDVENPAVRNQTQKGGDLGLL